MARLFEEKERTRQEPMPLGTSMFEVLDTLGIPEVKRERDFLEELYAIYPDSSNRLRRELMHSSINEFFGALGSLVMHDRYHSMFPTVRVDEDTSGNDKKPDFQFFNQRGQLQLTIEVTALCSRGPWAEHNKLVDELVDRLNANLTSEDYHIGLYPDPLTLWKVSPPDSLVEEIGETLRRLPSVEEARAVYDASGEGISYSFDSPNGAIEVTFLPCRVKAHGRIVGMWSGAGGTVNTAERLRRKLQEKYPSQYPKGLGIDAAPYVIAIMMVDGFGGIEYLSDALFGSQVLTSNSSGDVVRDESGNACISRGTDGSFTRLTKNRQPRNTAVSGVLFIDKFSIPNLIDDRSRTYFVQNPFAKQPVNPELFKADYYFLRSKDDPSRLEWVPPLPDGES